LSRDTWSTTGGQNWEIIGLLETVSALLPLGCDGITISGGEPFEQSVALNVLLPAMRELIGPDRDLLCYSGFPYALLRKRHANLLEYLDALIPEPFRETASPGKRWRGSSNQPLVALSALGEARYAKSADDSASKCIQVAVDQAGVWFIGIPQAGDLTRFENILAGKGIRLGSVSWRA
jgi:anaerobic ribonucleoside-triphosphate reductase activating protein